MYVLKFAVDAKIESIKNFSGNFPDSISDKRTSLNASNKVLIDNFLLAFDFSRFFRFSPDLFVNYFFVKLVCCSSYHSSLHICWWKI